MNTERVHDFFFELLRAGLWDTEPGFELPVLGDKEWGEISRIAREQAVFGIICNGISHLPENRMPSSGMRISMMVGAQKISQTSARVKEISDRLVGIFIQSGLHPVVVKGPQVARLYPNPGIRSSGDIDICFPGDEFLKAAVLIRSRKIEIEKEPDGSDVYSFEGITIEHHSHYFDLHAKADRLPPVPSPEAELLMLSSHILKHAIGAGIGLKQICDVAIALRHLTYDRRVFLEYVSATGTRGWNDLLCSFMVDNLGLKREELPEFRKVSSERLMKIILSGGNFGHHDKSRVEGKKGTAALFLKRLPFSMRIAPVETLRTIADLIRGNFVD